MFDKNILTFNPGWDSNAQKLAAFTDVRQLQRQLKAQGVKMVKEADESTTGPASFVAVDPDGNRFWSISTFKRAGKFSWAHRGQAWPACLLRRPASWAPSFAAMTGLIQGRSRVALQCLGPA